MNLRNVSAPARTALGVGAVAAAFGLFATDLASAQQSGQPAQPTQREQRQQQQRQQPRQQQPAQKPAQPAPAAQPATPQPQAAEAPPLIYSPWTKVCGKEGQPAGAQKEVCFTIKEARLDTGQFVASAGLIELEGEPKKILRVTLPLGLLLKHGTRMVVDSNATQAMMGVYNFCLPNGCWADFEVSQEFVASLKKGQSLTLQAFNLNGQVASFGFPLGDFAKSNDGPPTDPKELEVQQKKLQEELERRAKELGQRQGQAPQQPPAQQPPR